VAQWETSLRADGKAAPQHRAGRGREIFKCPGQRQNIDVHSPRGCAARGRAGPTASWPPPGMPMANLRANDGTKGPSTRKQEAGPSRPARGGLEPAPRRTSTPWASTRQGDQPPPPHCNYALATRYSAVQGGADFVQRAAIAGVVASKADRP